MNDQSNPALSRLRERTAYLRDLYLRIRDAEAALNNLRAEARALSERELVEMFNEAGADAVGLPASGNLPAMDAELRPYYSANIAASWEPDRREQANLADAGAADLMLHPQRLDFPRDSRASVLELSWLKKLRMPSTIKDSGTASL